MICVLLDINLTGMSCVHIDSFEHKLFGHFPNMNRLHTQHWCALQCEFGAQKLCFTCSTSAFLSGRSCPHSQTVSVTGQWSTASPGHSIGQNCVRCGVQSDYMLIFFYTTQMQFILKFIQKNINSGSSLAPHSVGGCAHKNPLFIQIHLCQGNQFTAIFGC